MLCRMHLPSDVQDFIMALARFGKIWAMDTAPEKAAELKDVISWLDESKQFSGGEGDEQGEVVQNDTVGYWAGGIDLRMARENARNVEGSYQAAPWIRNP